MACCFQCISQDISINPQAPLEIRHSHCFCFWIKAEN